MSTEQKFRLKVAFDSPMADYAHVNLYNGVFDTIYSGYGPIDLQLNKGIYKLTVSLNKHYQEKMISVFEETHINLELPKLSSSLIAEGFANNHEYYATAARRYILERTAPALQSGAESGLFIFFRFVDKGYFTEFRHLAESLGEGFKILDAKRKLLCDLRGEYIAEDYMQHGWLAFNVSLSPGNYYLYYGGTKGKKWPIELPAREIPLRVCNRWQTQVFMTFSPGPNFGSLQISFSDFNNPQLDSGSQSAYDIEAILQKFVNGIYYLPENVLREMSYGKWENPMLGIIAAHAYHRQEKRNNEELFRNVVNNLGHILGQDTPDIKALQLMFSRFYSHTEPIHLTEPCMMANGMQTLVTFNADELGYQVISPNSTAEKLLENIYTDLAWTSYKPISGIHISTFKKESDQWINFLEIDDLPVFKSVPRLPEVDFLSSDVENIKPRNPRKPAIINSWLANSILDMADKNIIYTSNIPKIAASLEITPTGLTKTIQTIIKQEDRIKDYLNFKYDQELHDLFNPKNIDKLKEIEFPTFTPTKSGK